MSTATSNCNNCGAPFNPAGSCNHCGTIAILPRLITAKAIKLKEFVLTGRMSADQASDVTEIALHNREAALINAVTEAAVREQIEWIDEIILSSAKKGQYKATFKPMHPLRSNPHMAEKIVKYYRSQGYGASYQPRCKMSIYWTDSKEDKQNKQAVFGLLIIVFLIAIMIELVV